jgi:NAD(P)-dependent dehydrogenase (short-subunit alcohol dehydrogenase family)
MAAVTKSWFITGASSGLGLEMALSALRAGHRVIGTGRDIQRAAVYHPEFETLGGQWLQLDLSQPSAKELIEQTLAQEDARLKPTEKHHWVIVNNAGSSLLGAVEDMSENQLTAYLQFNIYGPIRVWKAALPILRQHRQGTLITISSIFGFVSKSEHMMYSACKAATESLTESYADLLSPLGIRVLLVEPGGFRTKFAANASQADLGITDDYAEKIEAWTCIVNSAAKDETIVSGDPEKFGERMLQAVDGLGLFERLWANHEDGKALRVQLGLDSYEIFGARLGELSKAHAEMADVAKSTDVHP